MFIFNLSAQNREVVKHLINSDLSIKQKQNQLDSLISKLENKKTDSLAFIYSDYGFWLAQNTSEIKKAIKYGEKALLLSKQEYSNNTYLIQLYSNDLAYYYEDNNEMIKATSLFKENILLDNTSYNGAISYFELGSLYYNSNNYYKAYEYYEVAISLLSDFKGVSIQALLRNIYRNLSNICFKIKSKESLKNGQIFGRLADSLARKVKTPLIEIFNIKFSLAQTFTEEENLDFESANKYYNQALKIAIELNDKSKQKVAYHGLGSLYNIIDQTKSIDYYNKSLDLTKSSDSLFLDEVYYGLGQTNSIWKNYKVSLDYKYKSLQFLTGKDFFNVDNISYNFLIKFKRKQSLLIGLTQLAQTYLNYYNQENNLEFLKKTITYFKMCDILIDALKTDSNGFKSRLYWRELSTDIYGKAINACYLNNDLESAFYFMEKNKALLLLEDISRNKIKETLNLDSKVLIKEKELIQQLAIVNDALTNEAILSQSEIDSLKKQRIDLDIERDILLKDIPTTTLTIETAITSLKEVQNKLNDNEVVIEYHISADDGYGIYTSKENGYVLFITKDDTKLFEINNLSDLEKDIITYTKLLKTPFKTVEDKNSFNILSHHIYKRLFPSKEVKQLIKGKISTIIPDRYLSFLPFETLSTLPDQVSYLIKDTEIHYSYSNSFSKNTKKESPSNAKSFTVAPINFKNTTLSTLNNSEQEIEVIQSLYPGVSLTYENASKANFLSNLSSNGIIHIASHANAQDKTAPWIAFNDENITLEELYLTQNNASLVFLSGCNTTLGEQAIGEGIMSLARGFFYSGSQSVISSLWTINDLVTLEITNDFYKNLSEGQTKATALHNAKVSYLDTHTLSEASPYYWASLILLGENDTLPSPKTPWAIYFSIVLIIGLIFLLFIKRKRIKSQ